MKNKIYSLLYAVFIVCSICSCKNESLNASSVYLTSAEVSNTGQLTVDNSGGEQAFNITATQPAESSVSAEIVADPSLIASYNERFGTSYEAVPDGAYTFSSGMVSIQPGTTLSNSVTFRITGTDKFEVGKAYMMPITIREVSGLPLIEASKTFYLIIKQVIITNAAVLTNNYFKVDFSKNNESLRAMSNITMETRVMANSFQTSSPFISSIMGIEEAFLLRFGDVTVQPNQLQAAGGVTATNVNFAFNTGTWYHIAAVYDAGKLRVYVDGQLLATTTANRVFDLTNTKDGFYFGRSAQGRGLNGAISEARIWSRALSQAEITNGICGVDPSSAGLVGYWKFNAAEGRSIKDISGHNRDAVAASNIQWTPSIRCE
ncbi:DUF1735 and LamG domain-containing protein [Sphingobacterium paludis]|uniref:Uncharacterized protein DUF1735 n=1 Tax=Sphingobacterium paludis TaxID=1476465 RepID=A0A4R7CTE7_9SPHI|nr:DUF1735 and LamG domain-containing protein [Sphingobacterium paludis]TDS08896.1 uncharacterized protein DUF1735 [Sphingobacterium paludis]